MKQFQVALPSSTLPFVLLWAENMPNQAKADASLIFSASSGGMIQDPDGIHSSTESTGGTPEDEKAADYTASSLQ